jgi:dTDP-L-rhamnose 4-epimerase
MNHNPAISSVQAKIMGAQLGKSRFLRGDKILVTGGAGFVGSHTVDLLLERGYQVRILDSLQARVHPKGKPSWVPSDAEFIKGDVTNPLDLARALAGTDGVFHLAAYQDYLNDFSNFIHTNTESSARLFELIVSDPRRFSVKKIVFASSQSVCGEGRYLCFGTNHIAGLPPEIKSARPTGFAKRHAPDRNDTAGSDSSGHGVIVPGPRPIEQLRRGDWEVRCPQCHSAMEPLLTDEDTVYPHTAYAISKYAIEMLADRIGRRYGIPTTCMRYTYVQGPRNSFYNAYSGIARRFAMRIMHGLPPIVYEDGGQLRDYVNVRDVALANVMALESDDTDFDVLNVGGERAITVLEFARLMLNVLGSKLEATVSGEFRLGDTRHTVSDVSRMRRLGWRPKIQVEQNVLEYVEWLQTQAVDEEYLLEAERVMRELGVVQAVGAS